MDKTYSEVMGQAPFDWKKWLDAAIAGEVPHEEYLAKFDLSIEWTTCACGNQCAIIPRFPDGLRYRKGAPLDPLLRSLGGEFSARIGHGNWKGAKETLAQIEARSAVLIAEELKKLNS